MATARQATKSMTMVTTMTTMIGDDDDDDDDGDDDDDYGDAIGDSQLCCLRFNGIVEEDTTMCLLDEGDHRSP
jgi:hypothetical protein